MIEIIGDGSYLDQKLFELLTDKICYGIKDIYIPAGGTPESFYQYLVENQNFEWSRVNLNQIDEVVTGEHKGMFQKFFKEKLNSLYSRFIPISPNHVQLNNFISFLGLGVNGHVAFHEPHLPDDFTFGEVVLGDETCDYLNLNIGTKGLTYGLGHFLKSETIYLMVKGKHKANILKKFLENDPKVPAVKLKTHPNLILLADFDVWNEVIS